MLQYEMIYFKRVFFYVVLLVFFMLCCTSKNIAPDKPDEIRRSVTCYEYISKKDSVYLKTYQQGDSIFGTLKANDRFIGKSSGEVNGYINNSIMWLMYKYDSSGYEKNRQIAFKKVGDYLIPGKGALRFHNNFARFAEIDKVTFPDSFSLEIINCK